MSTEHHETPNPELLVVARRPYSLTELFEMAEEAQQKIAAGKTRFITQEEIRIFAKKFEDDYQAFTTKLALDY